MSSFRKPVQIRRRAAGRWQAGRWLDGAEAPLVTVLASVQPAHRADYDGMQALSEGRRIDAMVRIYTDAMLNVAGADRLNGDLIVWRGGPRPGDYLVVAMNPWQSGVIPHYRYLAVLEVEA
ncbi:hypothetical protein [Cupriavidus sp. D384]|uniref:hypothetical protein n=1 Tax=Cupriavidus sp. D384 TaxID=1538095 RepID=UPI000829CFE8|nr:hypothetical protein [Cupriavidus sp. D384]